MSSISKMNSEALAEKYENEFRPDSYLKTYYSNDFTFLYTSNVLGMLHRIFSICKYNPLGHSSEGKWNFSFNPGTDIPTADSMLDLGCGPTIYASISASKSIQKIVLSDFLDRNLQEVKKWVKKEAGAMDWSNCFKEVAKLENEPDPRKLEHRVRNAIKDFVHCDVRLPNPIAPHIDQFDVIFTGLMYESVSTSNEMFVEIVSNSANLLKPGGHFIYGGVSNCTSYGVGDVLFPGYPITKAAVDNALADAKLKPLLWSIFPRLENNDTPDDSNNSFLVLAKKC